MRGLTLLPALLALELCRPTSLVSAAGLTYSPKMVFVDNYQSLFFSIEEENCARAFQSMYQNLAVLGVWAEIKEDNPCALCQQANKNSHCCQTYDPATGVCACNVLRSGIARMQEMCKLMKGQFAYMHASFTGMYGDDYTYIRYNHTVTCVPELYLSCSYAGITQVLKAFAQQCADGNSRIHPDARCTFRIDDFTMRDPLSREPLMERKLTATSTATSALPALHVMLLAWAALATLQHEHAECGGSWV